MNNLIINARNGDPNAFVQLIEENKQYMYKIAMGFFSGQADIDDVMAETVMVCWEKISTLQKPEYFKTWLTRILINKCNDILRERKKTISLDDITDVESHEFEPESLDLELLLNELDYKYRIVLILHYSHGYKTEEISDMLHIPVGTVTSRLKRGREHLAKILKGGIGNE